MDNIRNNIDINNIKQKLGFDILNTEFDDDINWKIIDDIIDERGLNGLLLYSAKKVDARGYYIQSNGYYDEYNSADYQTFIAFNIIANGLDNESITIKISDLIDSLPLEYHIKVNNFAFIWACYVNNIDLVKYFLSLPSININFHYGNAFKYACTGNHIEIVDLLLKDNRLEICVDKYESPLDPVFAEGYIEITKLLIDSGKYDFSIDDFYEWYAAIKQPSIVDLFLNNDILRINIKDNILAYAITNDVNAPVIVKMLLYDERINPLIDPSINDNHCIKKAIILKEENNRTSILELLLYHPKVQETLSDELKIMYENMLGG